MMGSRGDVSPQVMALATLIEIAELLRNADKALPADVARMRTVHDELKKADAAHDARQAELDKRAADLAEGEANLAEREVAFEAVDAETRSQQATFDRQATALTERGITVEVDERSLSDAKMAFITKMAHERSMLDADRQAQNAATERAWREGETALRVERDRLGTEFANKQSLADAQIEARKAECKRREDAVAASEQAIHARAAQLRQVLGEG